MSIFLPALVEVSGYGTEVLDYRDGFDLTTAGVKHSSAVTMELTHRTERLCVTWIRITMMIYVGRVMSKQRG